MTVESKAEVAPMRVLGITGTLGAGKGTIVEYLLKEKGFKHYSVRAYLLEVIAERKMPPNRDSMRVVANGLREKHNPAYIVEQLYKKAVEGGGDAIIESIRTPGEVAALRELCGDDFQLIACSADEKVRYDRVVGRQSETDRVTFEQFCEQERKEMSNVEPHKQNLGKCIELSDHVLVNDSSLEALHAKLEGALFKVKDIIPITYVEYQDESQLPLVTGLIEKDLSEPYSIYTYRYFMNNWPFLTYLAMSGDKCVGCIVCKLAPDRKQQNRGYIAMLAVDTTYRKRGIGSTLVKTIIKVMRERGADLVVLETEITNMGSLGLYDKLGFVREKRLKKYYLNGVDAFRLKMWLHHPHGHDPSFHAAPTGVVQ